jgi:DNA-binding IclR family transcriptional regulator
MPASAFELPSHSASSGKVALRFTPAEWRRLLEDASFLRDRDNSYAPRRLMGLPVEIVPDHRFG